MPFSDLHNKLEFFLLFIILLARSAKTDLFKYSKQEYCSSYLPWVSSLRCHVMINDSCFLTCLLMTLTFCLDESLASVQNTFKLYNTFRNTKLLILFIHVRVWSQSIEPRSN